MPLQRNCHNRWIHPHIIDWPRPWALNNKAALPILAWEAGYAHEVVEQIERDWRQIVANPTTNITAEWGVSNVMLPTKLDGERLSVSWQHTEPRQDVYDVVILAVGFGEEKDQPWQSGYWEGDYLDAQRSAGKNWLISGTGDGGLIDLMRLCLDNFKHHQILELLLTNRNEAECLRTEVEEIERMQLESVDLEKRYRQLDAPKFRESLQKMRRNVNITLNCSSGYLYNNKSSPFNRFVTSQLHKLRAFDICKGKVKPPKWISDKSRFQVDTNTTGYYHRVVYRHGPNPALRKSFITVWKACEDLRRCWEKLADDQTSIPMWRPDDFSLEGYIPELRSLTAILNISAPLVIVSEQQRIAANIAGMDTEMYGKLPPPYDQSVDLRKKALQETNERLLAAWLYLDATLDNTDSLVLLRRYGAIGKELYLRLREPGSDQDKRFQQIIKGKLYRFSDLTQASLSTASNLEDLMANVKEWKDTYRIHRDCGEYEQALDAIQKTIKMLETAHTNFAYGNQAKIVSELADCYGMLGGLYRRKGNLNKAINAYDKGYLYETEVNKSTSSYNLVNRLLLRVLAGEHDDQIIPEGGTLHSELEAAQELVIDQVVSQNRINDVWALADLFTLACLLGPYQAINHRFNELLKLSPQKHQWDTVAEVMYALAEVRPKDKNITHGFELLESSMKVSSKLT